MASVKEDFAPSQLSKMVLKPSLDDNRSCKILEKISEGHKLMELKE